MLSPFCAALLVLATGAIPREPSPAPGPAHRVLIRVVGPVALVQVEREVLIGGEKVPAHDTVVDLDLPEGASLLDWGAQGAGQAIKMAATTETSARADYARVL